MGSQMIGDNSSSSSSQQRSRQPLPQQSTKRLVCDVPNHVSLDDIRTLLAPFGDRLTLEQGGATSDSSFSIVIDFESEEDLKIAYNELTGVSYQDSELKVEIQMEPQPGSSRGGPGPGRGTRGAYRPPNYGGPPSSRPTDFPLRILVLSDMIGAIIGRAGGTIKQITQETRARVDVHRKENAGSPEKVITIYGNPENCSKACQKIMEVMQQEANNTNRAEVPLKILAHNNLIGRIIGKSGNTIKRIMEMTNTKISVSSNVHDVNSFNVERVISIKGKLEDICRAEQMISAKLKQSYDSDLAAMAPQTLMFPGLHPTAIMSTVGSYGFLGAGAAGPSYGLYGGPPSYMAPVMPYTAGPAASPVNTAQAGAPPMPSLQQQEQVKETVYLYIPNSAVGAIIGTGGSAIREMINSSGANIKVAQPSKEEQSAAEGAQGSPEKVLCERKVTIVGTPESQWKAQFMVFRKVGYEVVTGPQEATLKVEIFVPSSQVGRIIGKGGATVRELQRLTHATIKLPEEEQNNTAEETPVHMIGDFLSTQAAQRQIRALVMRGTQPSGQRGFRQKFHHNHQHQGSGDSSQQQEAHSPSTVSTQSQRTTPPPSQVSSDQPLSEHQSETSPVVASSVTETPHTPTQTTTVTKTTITTTTTAAAAAADTETSTTTPTPTPTTPTPTTTTEATTASQQHSDQAQSSYGMW